MKRFAAALLAALISLCCLTAAAETGPLTAQLVSYHEGELTVARGSSTVDFGDVVVTDLAELEAFLDQLQALRQCDMFATTVTADWCEALTARYPEVAFGWTISFADHVIRTDATAFSTLHMSGAATHSAEQISAVKYCKQLRALDFGHNGVDDISFLTELPELRVLIIACNRVTDLSPIASLSHLEYLELFSNRVTDLSPLAGLEHLTDLNLGYNRIRDFSPLYGMKSLKRLWIFHATTTSTDSDGRIDRAVLKALREALPGCQINAVSKPTAGGWRDHPHYEVLHRMMRTGVYEPFEDSWPEE